MHAILRTTFALPVLALAALVLGGLSTDALAYKRQSSVTGAGGKTATKEVNANRTAKGYERSSSASGPGGKTASTQSSGSYDKETNTWTKDKSATGPGGKTKSWQKSTTVTK